MQILEDDDGSGWVKVTDEHGGKGLVPASYVQATEGSDEEPDEPTPAPAAVAPAAKTSKVRPPPPNRSTKPSAQPKILGSGQYVKGLYAYQASGPDEIDVEDGELIELSAGPNGGQNYADGWWEGMFLLFCHGGEHKHLMFVMKDMIKAGRKVSSLAIMCVKLIISTR